MKKQFTIIPVPYEATTTYGQGTRNGPKAILAALPYVEEFDEELKFAVRDKAEIKRLRSTSLDKCQPLVSGIVRAGAVPVILGGEHSITPRIVKPIAKRYKNLSVLQLDAHADLRDKYKGDKFSHACAMRRVLEICPAVQVGLRSISKEGYEFAKQTKQIKKMHWAKDRISPGRILRQLSRNIYITIDVDVFDPSIISATGTPEPGGMGWYQVLDVLRAVCRRKNVVGFDLVELSPRKGDIASDFTVAKLVYKIIALSSL